MNQLFTVSSLRVRAKRGRSNLIGIASSAFGLLAMTRVLRALAMTRVLRALAMTRGLRVLAMTRGVRVLAMTGALALAGVLCFWAQVAIASDVTVYNASLTNVNSTAETADISFSLSQNNVITEATDANFVTFFDRMWIFVKFWDDS